MLCVFVLIYCFHNFLKVRNWLPILIRTHIFALLQEYLISGDSYYVFIKANCMQLAQFFVPSYALWCRYGMLSTSAMHGPECAVVADSSHVFEPMVEDGAGKTENQQLIFLGPLCVSMAGWQ